MYSRELAQKAMGDYIYYEAGYLKQVEDDMLVRILTVGVLLGIIVVLVVAFVLKKSFRLAKEITDPIASLSENVRKVGYGDFRIQSVETNVIEVKNLNQGVQKMARRIETAFTECSGRRTETAHDPAGTLAGAGQPSFPVQYA